MEAVRKAAGNMKENNRLLANLTRYMHVHAEAACFLFRMTHSAGVHFSFSCWIDTRGRTVVPLYMLSFYRFNRFVSSHSENAGHWPTLRSVHTGYLFLLQASCFLTNFQSMDKATPLNKTTNPTSSNTHAITMFCPSTDFLAPLAVALPVYHCCPCHGSDVHS